MANEECDPRGEEQPPTDDDGSELYGVFGEGRPRRIVGESDEPPRRRPRKKPDQGADGSPPADR